MTPRRSRDGASAPKGATVPGLFFFFSSRRRHTRYWRDWSSDVCSSDLERRVEAVGEIAPVGFGLLQECFERPFELRRGLLHAEAHQTEGRALVEDHDQDHALGDERDVDVVLLTLVKEDGELLLADQ